MALDVKESPSDDTYAAGRSIHDADSHITEWDGFYEQYAEPSIRERMASERIGYLQGPVDIESLLAEQRDRSPEDVMLHKRLQALGAFDPIDRSRALDQIGFQSQLVFTSSLLRALNNLDRAGDEHLSLGVTAAHNRGILDFCANDPRLLPVCWVPLASIDKALEIARSLIDAGAAALMIPSECPVDHSPSHIGLDPLWAMAEEAGRPIVFHVGGNRRMDETYNLNGLPRVKDFIGGDDNFTSVSFMAIPESPMQTLATMVIDGVLDRFPRLRLGVIEQGASWLPGWMRSLDAAADAFVKNEDRLKNLGMKPSEFVRRQVRVTPYPHEDVGWIVRNSDPRICMFSSDYPHIEGGRNPIKRFDNSLQGVDEESVDRFYRLNFLDLVGSREATG